MFKFNFDVNDNGEVSCSKSFSPIPRHDEANQVPRLLSQRHLFLDLKDTTQWIIAETICGKLPLLKRHLDDIKYQIAAEDDEEDSSNSQPVRQAILQQTDVIPGVYEGGLKTWECSLDVVDYLQETFGCENSMTGKRVLELGCGSALPGIWCASQGAQVDFQDYNVEVLRMLTLPNLLLNLRGGSCSLEEEQVGEEFVANESSPDGVVEKKLVFNRVLEGEEYRFFSGDWSHFKTVLHNEQQKYDIIITSETIYDSSNHSHLLECIQEGLSPAGFCLVAGKSVYLGPGGCMAEFQSSASHLGFQSQLKRSKFEQCIGREVVQLEWKEE